MSENEPALVRELRERLHELMHENARKDRQIEELRGAIVALMEDGMPRVLLAKSGIMIMDEKWVRR